MGQKTKITANLAESRRYIEKRFCAEQNFDFVIRDFKVRFEDGYADGFLIFYDGMTDKTFINRDIMRSLLQSGVPEPLSAPCRETIFGKDDALWPFNH